jgi:ankyrin repeat protein
MSWAIESGILEIVKWGVDRGAAISDGLLALVGSHDEILRYLGVETGPGDSKLGANSDSVSCGDPTKDRLLRTVDALLAGVPEKRRSGLLSNALCAAAAKANQAMVQFWLDWGVDVNGRSENGKTPLLAAVTTTRPDARVISTLLERGADINCRVVDFWTHHIGGNACELTDGRLFLHPLRLSSKHLPVY